VGLTDVLIDLVRLYDSPLSEELAVVVGEIRGGRDCSRVL